MPLLSVVQMAIGRSGIISSQVTRTLVDFDSVLLQVKERWDYLVVTRRWQIIKRFIVDKSIKIALRHICEIERDDSPPRYGIHIYNLARTCFVRN